MLLLPLFISFFLHTYLVGASAIIKAVCYDLNPALHSAEVRVIELVSATSLAKFLMVLCHRTGSFHQWSRLERGLEEGKHSLNFYSPQPSSLHYLPRLIFKTSGRSTHLIFSRIPNGEVIEGLHEYPATHWNDTICRSLRSTSSECGSLDLSCTRGSHQTLVDQESTR